MTLMPGELLRLNERIVLTIHPALDARIASALLPAGEFDAQRPEEAITSPFTVLGLLQLLA
jgi:hypothetical protein